MTDLSTGLYAYGAIMAALLYRQKTGKGQHIDCNLLNTQVRQTFTLLTFCRVLCRKVVSVLFFVLSFVIVSLQVATLTHIASNYLNCDVEAERWGTGHGSIVPYQVNLHQNIYTMGDHLCLTKSLVNC